MLGGGDEATETENSNEAITVDSSYFKIVNGENTYEPDTMASSTANEDGLGLFFEQIKPGSSRNTFVVFDITQDVVGSEDKQVQSGMLGTETGIIKKKAQPLLGLSKYINGDGEI